MNKKKCAVRNKYYNERHKLVEFKTGKNSFIDENWIFSKF